MSDLQSELHLPRIDSSKLPNNVAGQASNGRAKGSDADGKGTVVVSRHELLTNGRNSSTAAGRRLPFSQVSRYHSASARSHSPLRHRASISSMRNGLINVHLQNLKDDDVEFRPATSSVAKSSTASGSESSGRQFPSLAHLGKSQSASSLECAVRDICTAPSLASSLVSKSQSMSRLHTSCGNRMPACGMASRNSSPLTDHNNSGAREVRLTRSGSMDNFTSVTLCRPYGSRSSGLLTGSGIPESRSYNNNNKVICKGDVLRVINSNQTPEKDYNKVNHVDHIKDSTNKESGDRLPQTPDDPSDPYTVEIIDRCTQWLSGVERAKESYKMEMVFETPVQWTD